MGKPPKLVRDTIRFVLPSRIVFIRQNPPSKIIINKFDLAVKQTSKISLNWRAGYKPKTAL
jgi:hypothetical protein